MKTQLPNIENINDCYGKCTICLEYIYNKDYILTICHHIYHNNCYNKHINTNDYCPNCKRKLIK